MPDEKRFSSEPDQDLDGTQPVETVDASKHLPPPPGRSHVQLPSRPQQARGREKRKPEERTSSAPRDPRKPAERKRADDRRDRSKSGLYLPAWSVLLMLLTVFAVAFGIITLVIGLGGGAEPSGSPRIIIITAVPSDTPDAPAAVPTSPGIVLPDQNPQSNVVPDFPLEGPTLPPIILSPTPVSIQVGSMVFVNAEGGLNVRAGAGLDNRVLFNADNGSSFTITDGPTQANGLAWWEIRDPSNPDRFGWAAADYLRVQASQ
jgi:hypothetical protein